MITYLDKTGTQEVINAVKSRLNNKQDKLAAGDNIIIDGNTITAKGVPALETSGEWSYRVYDDNTFEAWYYLENVEYEISAASGGVYRSSLQTITLPESLTSRGNVSISYADIMVGANKGFPVWTALAAIEADHFTFYVVSGNTRGTVRGYLATARVTGAITS